MLLNEINYAMWAHGKTIRSKKVALSAEKSGNTSAIVYVSVFFAPPFTLSVRLEISSYL